MWNLRRTPVLSTTPASPRSQTSTGASRTSDVRISKLPTR